HEWIDPRNAQIGCWWTGHKGRRHRGSTETHKSVKHSRRSRVTEAQARTTDSPRVSRCCAPLRLWQAVRDNNDNEHTTEAPPLASSAVCDDHATTGPIG